MQVIERGWVSSNNIVFADAGGTAVVDTGYGRHATQTQALLRHALGGRALDRIVNTHTHSDHIGGNAALSREYPGVRIAIPAGEAQVVREWDEAALHLAPMGQECDPFAFDDTFDDGDVVELGGLAWRAIASPGHDMESLMLWCESEGILISADALWENGFGVIFPALPPAVDPRQAFAAQRATLETIATLGARLVIPGHGAPFADVTGVLARARSRIDYFDADPVRNTRNAMKVTLSFLLMIEGRLELSTLGVRLAGMSLLAHINRICFGLDDEGFAAMLAGELEKAGAARRVDGWLLPASS
jgi:glyoxylase-like metal-dependent hydrolase (beta-lactamase superfamily II)